MRAGARHHVRRAIEFLFGTFLCAGLYFANDMEALNALKYGTIGLCAILTFFAFQLLSKEQKTKQPRPEIIRLIQLFMVLAVISMAFGLCSQLPLFRPAATATSPPAGQWASGFGRDYFNANWDVQNAHDVPSPQFTFSPRYSYSGTLKGIVDGNDLVLAGDMTTYDIHDPRKELGMAKFTFRGPINKHQVAGNFSYIRTDVNGFGSAFVEFDSGGNGTMYMVVRITQLKVGEGDVAMVVMHLRRSRA